MARNGLTIKKLETGSIAGMYGLEPGDRIMTVNGHRLVDILDYHFLVKDHKIGMGVEKHDGRILTVNIKKDFDPDLGIVFDRTGLESIARCSNRCLFCFVDQMPGGLRRTLYIRDDDYRSSFLQGCFITLTNLNEFDMERIIRLRLSPLYVSVHTTNPHLREKMMGHRGAGKALKKLESLVEGGIRIHAQAVLCPGLNDGRELDRTVEDLSRLWPGVQSLAVVPVGLTRFRNGLEPLDLFTSSSSKTVVKSVSEWQKRFSQSYGYPFVFAGDEFYFLAGVRIPGKKCYADFPQVENGVGLSRLFMESWKKAKRRLPAVLSRPLKITLATGILGAQILKGPAEDLNRVLNLNVRVLAVENEFFGKSVTVAGLLTGNDFFRNRQKMTDSDLVVLPASAFNRDINATLDGMSTEDLSAKIGSPVKLAADGQELVDILLKGK